ncbi:hypothetical protein O181_050116 [Austropuccinia psidii MF-1]|uniref:Uncharacterized protein n=1 Tax=Austropuccinia psidii MF-1 TaxID=1389203 RepID=A0A9Q3HM21_9BASI|nr:hypothetical protein [Austropuccinia psidii MF-1]
MGPLGPFWTKSDEANHLPSRPGGTQTTSGPTCANFGPQSHQSHKWPKGPQEPRFGKFQPLGFGNNQRPQDQAQQGFPFIQGKDFSSPMYSVPWIQEWCIYGMIYHYALILLSNPMVMVSGPN